MAVKACDCSHKFQDEHYGKGQRLHNPTTKGWRCTVCEKEKLTGTPSKKEVKSKGK